MKKRNYYISIICLLLFSAGVLAQGKMDNNRIKLLKISFITEQIDLTTDEAEQFWPVYNSYNDRIHEARIALERGIQRDINLSGGIENLTNQQSDELIQRIMDLEETISSNKTEMTKALGNVISSKKILKLQWAEREFNRRMLQEYGRRGRRN